MRPSTALHNSGPRYNAGHKHKVLEGSVGGKAEEGAPGRATAGAGQEAGREAMSRALPFVLGILAPFLISASTRFLRTYAEAIYRDTVPLLLVLVFVAFTVIAVRRLPGRIGFVALGLYLGATLGTVLDVLAYPDPERQLVGEILALWWFAAPGILGGVMLAKARSRRSGSGTGRSRDRV